jgi:hypothetical protein
MGPTGIGGAENDRIFAKGTRASTLVSLPKGTASDVPVSVRDVTDRAQAEAVVGDSYLPNRLEVSARESRRLDTSLTVLRLGQLTVGRLGYGKKSGW